MKSDLFVSVTAPLYNDASIIGDFVAEVTEVLKTHYANYEIVLVDDGSDDGTSERVQQILANFECVRFIQLSRTFGLQIALAAGLEASIGDFVVVMIPKSDPPALIPDIVEKCRDGVGIVSGVDISPPRRSALGALLNSVFHWYVRRILGMDLLPGATNFRVFSRQAVNALTQIRDRYWQLRLLAASVGFRRFTFTYKPLHRSSRPPHPSLMDQFSEAVDIVIANSMHPLRFVSRLGLLAGFVNLVYLGYVVVIYLAKRDVAPGWTTLSFQHGVMFFLIFVILTVVCEYIGRILEGSRKRPLYFVYDEKSSSVQISDAMRRNVVRESK